ncbi:arylsulfatase B-like isoform X3 [Pseudomyrmex gracilis]|uniref:arylsulfatase B-like isoform X3 n=1 Tax=Pseudomyrmex gracilis TaxID=219809 RepID=UPI000994CD5F|nr:arylsulfatase B-like isoform X3 [Pseudomyrmex gracilis]
MVCSTVIWNSMLVLCFALLFKIASGLYETAPHIIVFIADDLGWNDVSFHGSNQILTPNIDALGYNGIILNRHYVLPSSSASRSAFFTGQYPIRLGMQGRGIDGGEPRGLPLNVRILPEYLRDLGYMTKLIGKWHVGYHTPLHIPQHRGFDLNMSGYDMHRGDTPAYDITAKKYVTDLFTDEALQIIQDHQPYRPLYLQISHLAVHAPIESPREYDYDRDKQFMHIRDPNRRKYARMVSRLDDSVGRIVHALGDKGMLKNSLVLFLTDNGAAPIGKDINYGSNYPLRGMKYTLYEGGVRGVAVLWSPRLNKAARVCDNLIHITDWLPTLYFAAGGDLRDLGTIDGVNQWNMLSEAGKSTRDKLLLNIDEVTKTEGAIYKQFKLVRGSIEGGRYDAYHSDHHKYERLMPQMYSKNYDRKSVEEENVPTYTDIVLKSAVSQSITFHLGGPVTQPSTMTRLRSEATVYCQPNITNYHYEDTFVTCNVTECLFDVNNDPCETKNIAELYPRMAQELDRFLETYGRNVTRQIKVPVDWIADPRRSNNTWEPWITQDDTLYMYNATTCLVLAYYIHIGIVLATITYNAFI